MSVWALCRPLGCERGLWGYPGLNPWPQHAWLRWDGPALPGTAPRDGAGLPCQNSFLQYLLPVGLCCPTPCSMPCVRWKQLSMGGFHSRAGLSLWGPCTAGHQLGMQSHQMSPEETSLCSTAGKTPGPPPSLPPNTCVPVFGGRDVFLCRCACRPLYHIPETGPWLLTSPCSAELAGAVRGAGWDRTALQEVNATKQPPPERSFFPGQRWKEVAEKHWTLLHGPHELSTWRHEHREPWAQPPW